MSERPAAPVVLRVATPSDDDVLWTMLFAASRSGEDDGATIAGLRHDPALARYVVGYGRAGDHGVVAMIDGVAVGAAWVRLLVGEERRSPAFVADDVPELVIGVAPGLEGRGIGGALLDALLETVRPLVPAVTLNARDDNPAIRLYARHGFVEIGEIVNRVGTRSRKMLRSFS